MYLHLGNKKQKMKTKQEWAVIYNNRFIKFPDMKSMMNFRNSTSEDKSIQLKVSDEINELIGEDFLGYTK